MSPGIAVLGSPGPWARTPMLWWTLRQPIVNDREITALIGSTTRPTTGTRSYVRLARSAATGGLQLREGRHTSVSACSAGPRARMARRPSKKPGHLRRGGGQWPGRWRERQTAESASPVIHGRRGACLRRVRSAGTNPLMSSKGGALFNRWQSPARTSAKASSLRRAEPSSS